MKTSGKRLQASHGMVLMSALTILTVLLAVGIGIRVMLQNDYRVLSNLRRGTEAFYYSAAGLEWSKNELARDVACLRGHDHIPVRLLQRTRRSLSRQVVSPFRFLLRPSLVH